MTICLSHSFPITDDIVKPILDGKKISSLASDKRLFIVDLAIMEGVPTVKHCGKQLTVRSFKHYQCLLEEKLSLL